MTPTNDSQTALPHWTTNVPMVISLIWLFATITSARSAAKTTEDRMAETMETIRARMDSAFEARHSEKMKPTSARPAVTG